MPRVLDTGGGKGVEGIWERVMTAAGREVSAGGGGGVDKELMCGEGWWGVPGLVSGWSRTAEEVRRRSKVMSERRGLTKVELSGDGSIWGLNS